MLIMLVNAGLEVYTRLNLSKTSKRAMKLTYRPECFCLNKRHSLTGETACVISMSSLPNSTWKQTP